MGGKSAGVTRSMLINLMFHGNLQKNFMEISYSKLSLSFINHQIVLAAMLLIFLLGSVLSPVPIPITRRPRAQGTFRRSCFSTLLPSEISATGTNNFLIWTLQPGLNIF